jgi:hypothetical protein
MKALLYVITEAWRLCWQHAVHVAFYNCIWLAFQIPIVTGPPATAAMYEIAHRLSEGELLTPRDIWPIMREMFIPAWKWAAVNLLVGAIVVGNFWLARGRDGDLWIMLRLVWTVASVVWLAVNWLYWPLWLSESDRRVTNTLRNGLVLFLRAPGLVLLTMMLSLVVFVLSVVTIIPLVNGVMVWIAAAGLFTTERIIRQMAEES